VTKYRTRYCQVLVPVLKDG